MDESTSTSPPDAVTFGLAFGGTVLVLLVLVAGLAVVWANKRAADAKRGWNLVPVVKATRDLKPGTVLTRADVEPGELPEQFATATLVQPVDLARVLGKPLTMSLERGDTLWHAHVAPRAPLVACPALVRAAAGEAADTPEVRELLDAVAAEGKAPSPAKEAP
jgi:hypothetical protein